MQPGTEVNLQELINLRHAATALEQASLRKRLIMPGQKITSIRGRGIEFDATREYQAGDDIRSMAWRVTARNLKPHIKVYREEKERPVWLAIDLSPSMYFGTRCMFKSVKSIMQTALLGWSSLQKRERIGAMIAATEKPLIYFPQSGEKNFLTILNSLSEHSRLQPAFNDQQYLSHLLMSLQQHARSGNLIYLISDFFQFDVEIEKLILHLAQRAHVILNFVYDPLEAYPPPPYQYMLTNGKQKMLFNMHVSQNRQAYQQQFQIKLNKLKDFAHKYQIALALYCTDPKRGLEQ